MVRLALACTVALKLRLLYRRQASFCRRNPCRANRTRFGAGTCRSHSRYPCCGGGPGDRQFPYETVFLDGGRERARSIQGWRIWIPRSPPVIRGILCDYFPLCVRLQEHHKINLSKSSVTELSLPYLFSEPAQTVVAGISSCCISAECCSSLVAKLSSNNSLCAAQPHCYCLLA